MKKSPFLLVLPLCAGAFLLATPRAGKVVAQSLPDAPVVSSQTELDALARQNPTVNFDRAGHAFANNEARLFWNTDLESAKQQAGREGKPILMLRLLGNLSDEYSCANSRFFRVVFYPQSDINARLKRDFVLCWTSERPVPVVTIDMGDGRKLRRTLTGNSAHYLLDSSGRPLDVFPGLSTPQAFESWLENGQKLASEFSAQPAAKRAAFLAKWHETQLRTLLKPVFSPVAPPALEFGPIKPPDEATVNAQVEMNLKEVFKSNPLESNAPVLTVAQTRARDAGRLAMSKGVVESPVLGSSGFGAFPVRFGFLNAPQTPVLDAATRARIKAMNPLASSDVASSPVPVAVMNTQGAPGVSPMDVLIGAFESTLLIDTQINANFSYPIHALFARGHEGDFDSLNRKIYDRLFLTPRSDEWLGLTNATAFSALRNDGIERPNNDVRIAQSN